MKKAIVLYLIITIVGIVTGCVSETIDGKYQHDDGSYIIIQDDGERIVAGSAQGFELTFDDVKYDKSEKTLNLTFWGIPVTAKLVKKNGKAALYFKDSDGEEQYYYKVNNSDKEKQEEVKGETVSLNNLSLTVPEEYKSENDDYSDDDTMLVYSYLSNDESVARRLILNVNEDSVLDPNNEEQTKMFYEAFMDESEFSEKGDYEAVEIAGKDCLRFNFDANDGDTSYNGSTLVISDDTDTYLITVVSTDSSCEEELIKIANTLKL